MLKEKVLYLREILHSILWRLFEQPFELVTSPLVEKARLKSSYN